VPAVLQYQVLEVNTSLLLWNRGYLLMLSHSKLKTLKRFAKDLYFLKEVQNNYTTSCFQEYSNKFLIFHAENFAIFFMDISKKIV